MIAEDASLSRTLNFGFKPLRSRYVNTSSKALTIVGASRLGIARTIMAFVV